MASSLYLFLFFSLFLGHDAVELQASHHAYKSFQTSQSTSRNQPYRTGYHFQPLKNWMNDPNGPMIYKGIYHFFYQHNPKGPMWNDNLVWGHSTSMDLINWIPHDPAITPSQPSDIKGVWSGSATILPGGKPIILYTGIDQNNRQVQNLAMPKKLSDPYLKEWIKTSQNPLISPTDQIDPSWFRDPSTAWLGPDKKWRVIIGSEIKDKGLAVLYKSKDFIHWIRTKKPLYSAKHSGMWECLDFFPVLSNSIKGVNDTSIFKQKNIKHVLKASLFSTLHDCYTIGTYNISEDKYTPEEGFMDDSGLRYDYGKFYASKTFYDSAKNRRILWGWVNESSSKDDDIKKGWSGLQAIPRSLWLDKSGKQLIQWPIAEIKTLRGNQVELRSKLLQEGSLHEVTGITNAQADIEISFETTELEKAEILEPSWTNPQLLCSHKGTSVKGSLGPFGLLILASKDLQEHTAVFFRIFKGQHKYAVLMCSDQSRSSSNNNNDKTSYGAFLNVDPVHEKLTLRSLIDHSIVESFGGGGKACITARVYPTLAIDDEAHLYAFNSGTQKRDPLNVKVNKLSSTRTQLPYDYYYLKYCKPKKIVNNAENLGEVLRGDRIENSVYEFEMREDVSCKVACRVKLDGESAKNFKEKIDDEYRVNMILDNLPVAVLRQRRDGSQSTTYEHGFRVGFKGNYQGSKEEKYFINNHLSFRVMYHKDPETDSARIVGFEVTPNSINHEYKEWDEKNPQVTTCNKDTKNLVQGTAVPQEVEKNKEIVFTYDVTFKESDIKWASRWDTYLLMNDDQIHWFSIINSLMIVLFLSGMVAMIMMRTLYRDIANYNQLETQDEAQEETGWKLVHGDVFRAPTNAGLLCVYVGTGVQIFWMTLVTMIFALLGFLSPSNRGGLMTAMVLLWVFMGLFAGYSSARLYKMFKGTEWKKNTLKTAFMFPGILFAVFFVLNALIWGEQSSGAVPFGTMFALVFLWFGISVPLVFVGSYLGFKKPAIEDPVKTNKIPRQIPEQAWYMTPVFSILIGGILPFGAVFIELFFILTSIWLNQFYYIFGFLFIVFVILLITCAEITIVLCYFQLCSEDYYWWWRSYLTAGSSALYLFLYSVFYFFTKLEITKLVSGILYFGYMVIVSYAFFVVTGTIGFYACFWFVRKIYSSVKID